MTKVECATDRPIWPQGLNAPEKADRIPGTLNWDLFTGPAKLNPYMKFIILGTGAAGGTMEQVRWVTWLVISCINRSEL